MQRRTLNSIAAISLILALTSTPLRADTEGYQEVPTREFVDQGFWLIENDRPRACLILFAGGKGRLRISENGIKRENNFLVRSRDLFAARGFKDRKSVV